MQLKYPIFDLERGTKLILETDPTEKQPGEPVLCRTVSGREYWIPTTFIERREGVELYGRGIEGY